MARIDLVNINKTFHAPSSLLEKTISRTVLSIFWNTSAAEPQRVQGGSFSLKDINLTIPDGKTMVILGPSGCGKTTLLKVISGLLALDSGQVLYDGSDLTGTHPRDRQIGMVFQNYALYPHFSSKENILTYFRFRKKTPELDRQAQEKFQHTSDLMGVDIKHLLGRMPGNLSGGERQRVALARCITRDPVLFLLDEPFSNLDQKLREKYRINLKKLLRHFKISTVYVTHDQHEAIILADLISIMDQGEIVQVGTYQQLYQHPKNIFVAEFLNPDYETRAFNICEGYEINPAYKEMTIGFRPEDAVIVGKGEGTVRGQVMDVTHLPLKKKSVVTVQLKNCDIQLYSDQVFMEGEKVEVKINKMLMFDPKSGDLIGHK